MQKIVKFKDSIGTFDNFVDPELCKQLIKNFESDAKKNLAFNRQDGEKVSKGMKDDTSVMYYFNNNWNETNDLVCKIITEALDYYEKGTGFMKFCGIENIHFTGLKVQKTSPKQGYHVWHVEKDFSKLCPRALVYSIYLNDITEGGETEFLLQQKRIEPKEGRICIFPAYYPYVHRGNPPLKEDKYLLTSWLTT